MAFHFTTDWFSPNIELWQRHLQGFEHQPIHALEIGSWEGRSAVWMLEHILTHPESSLTCVDTFQGSPEHSPEQVESLYDRFQHNIHQVTSPAQVIVHRCSAQEFFQSKPQATYNLIYIDGSHYSWDVITEAICCWPLLQVGGILIFDDYLWTEIGLPHQQPKIAIDAFLAIFQDKLHLLTQDYQVFIQKQAP